MEKIWLSQYPEGVPHTIDPSAYPSLMALLQPAMVQHADKLAFTGLGGSQTYRQLMDTAHRVSAYLKHELGLAQGDRVAIMLPNVLQYPGILWGIVQAGLVVVNINPLFTAREVQLQLKDSGARAVFVIEQRAHVLSQVLSHGPRVPAVLVRLGDGASGFKRWCLQAYVRWKHPVPAWQLEHVVRWTDLMARPLAEADTDWSHVAVGPEDLAFLQYTGGTTGLPKGAMLTHGNMVANVMQALACIQPFVSSQPVILTALPLYHIFSLTANCLTFMALGAHNLLIVDPRRVSSLIRTWSRHAVTAITGVNTLFVALLKQPAFRRLDFSTLNLCLAGGMALQATVARQWQAVTGRPLLEAYGLTETSPAVAISPFHLKAFNGTAGLPVPSTEIQIVDPEGRSLPVGQAGELCVRGPQVMRGYWGKPEPTQAVLDADGWLHTGDVAVVDPMGYIKIVDRKKDLIVVSGFNVYPSEIEAVALEHPGVSEAAAVGVAHPYSGEAVKLFVVRRDPHLTDRAILDHCKAHLTGYKIPKHIVFRDALPKSQVGKVLRRALRDKAPPQA